MEEDSTQEDKAVQLAKAAAEVGAELGEAMKADPAEGVVEYFNNFYLKLPDGGSEDEKLYRQQISGRAIDVKDGNSPKRLGQNWEAFFRAVDQAVTDAGINIEEIRRLKNIFSLDRSVPNLTRLDLYVLKAFVQLRAEGYNQKDLVS